MHQPGRARSINLPTRLPRLLRPALTRIWIFLPALCRASEFRSGAFDTGFIERNMTALAARTEDRATAALGAAKLLARDMARIEQSLERAADAPASPWDTTDGFQLTGSRVTT